MSDSFSPDNEGPDPYAGQDLDGLLSGENHCIPEALRPLAPALDALRAPPMRSELVGEAEARAYFRKVMLGGESEPARPDARADEPRTLVLSAAAPGDESHAARRRHRHRRPPQRGRWQAKALAGIAATVVIVGAAALAVTLSSSGMRPAVAGGSHGATGTKSSAAAPGSNGVDGNGTPDPSVKPTPTTTPQTSGNSPSPTELCEKYFDFFLHPGQHASQAAEQEIYQQLTSLADGQGGVPHYCRQLLQPWAAPQEPANFPGTSGNPFPDRSTSTGGPQGSQGSQQSQGSQGTQGTGSSPGQGGNGPGGNDNGQGQNGPSGGARTSGG